jgi:putative glutamine amidotransferase
LIGIPSYHDTSLPDKMPERFAMSRPYLTALEAVDAAPVILPLALGLDTLRALFDRLDGLFMAGGGDLDPACYTVGAHPKTEGVDRLRDETELILTRWALEEKKPLLGVCRGVQTLNVAAGGTLIQDVGELWPNAIRHQYFPEKPRSYVAHDVTTVDGTWLADVLGTTAHVNSFHHQAVDQIAKGFRAAAYAPDGVIEAIEHEGAAFAVGVQWHPESLIESDSAMYALFEAFVRRAA